MKHIIETKDLTKKYGQRTIINQMNFRVETGEIYALLGLNGAGKTTTIKMLLGLIEPTYGQIRCLGKNFLNAKSTVLPMIGSIVEKPGFYENLTVLDNLRLVTNIVGIHKPGYIDEILEMVDIHMYLNVPVKKLNVTQKQKLAICRALLNSPEILILDEPMNDLDPKSINEIRTLFKRLSNEKGITIFISSHVLTEIEKLADRIAILHEGKIIKVFSRAEIFHLQKENILLKGHDIDLAASILRGNGIEISKINEDEIIVYHHSVRVLLDLLIDVIQIEEIYTRTYSLEDYFMDLVRGDIQEYD